MQVAGVSVRGLVEFLVHVRGNMAKTRSGRTVAVRRRRVRATARVPVRTRTLLPATVLAPVLNRGPVLIAIPVDVALLIWKTSIGIVLPILIVKIITLSTTYSGSRDWLYSFCICFFPYYLKRRAFLFGFCVAFLLLAQCPIPLGFQCFERDPKRPCV